ncbi:methylcobalamin:coenzyme M methyltransferase MtaA5 [methanogenic archaeon ISO4-H5]|nr:methylcobalamin:coenzyme M methyltransferase MtaA5 [methanogenic archaeon ISO4-H5]
MNSKDEIVRMFDGDRGDAHPPAIFTQSGTVGQMDSCGSHWPEANFDAEKMAELALQTNKIFGFATVRVPFCITVDADAFGCGIYPGSNDSQPSVESFRYCPEGEILDVPEDLISPDEFITSKRPSIVKEAADILSKNEDLFLIAAVNGPMACVNNLLGMENTMMALMMEPDRMYSWLKAVTPHLSEFARVLSETADCIMITEEASSEFTPPEYFDDVFQAYIPDVIAGAHKGAFCTTHTCGETLDIADRLCALGQDGISLQTDSDPDAYMQAMGKEIVKLGGVRPVDTLMMKKPEDVLAEAKHAAEIGFDIVTPECGVPPQTPNENLMALAHYREH